MGEHFSDTENRPGNHLSICGRGCHHHGCPGPKNANACGSRRRMTPLSRSDPVLRFVRPRQRFVRRCHEWKKAPASTLGRGKLAKRIEVQFGPSALHSEGRTLVKWRRPRLGTCSSAPKICSLKPPQGWPRQVTLPLFWLHMGDGWLELGTRPV